MNRRATKQILYNVLVNRASYSTLWAHTAVVEYAAPNQFVAPISFSLIGGMIDGHRMRTITLKLIVPAALLGWATFFAQLSALRCVGLRALAQTKN